jgi:hypothetical protein
VIVSSTTLSERTINKGLVDVDFKTNVFEILYEVTSVSTIDNYIVAKYGGFRVISLAKRIDDERHQLEGITIPHRRNLPWDMILPIAPIEHTAP